MSLTLSEALENWEILGRAGLTVSVACGPCGLNPFQWTVQVMNQHFDEFDRPFAAIDFPHAVAIAMVECAKRGWLPTTP
jgi:hypothetical protein